MCSIGWIKTETGFILFKNRERDPEENVLSNFISKKDDLLTFEDKKFGGCWAGFKQNFAIIHILGPYREVPEGYQDKENFELNKTVLEQARSIEEATELYKKLFREQKLGYSYRIILCNQEKAIILELALDKVASQVETDVAFGVNSFQLLTEHNQEDQKLVARSEARLKKLKGLVKGVKKVEDILPILKFHSDNEQENICRHDESVTVASMALEVKDDEIILYYLLNESPCKGEYKKETMVFPLV